MSGTAGIPVVHGGEDVKHRLSTLRRAGLTTPELEAAIQALDDHFGSFSGAQNAARWSEEALYSDPAWERARELARVILKLIGTPP